MTISFVIATAFPCVVDYQLWENVSHFVMMEKPREFNEALVAFSQQNQLLD